MFEAGYCFACHDRWGSSCNEDGIRSGAARWTPSKLADSSSKFLASSGVTRPTRAECPRRPRCGAQVLYKQQPRLCQRTVVVLLPGASATTHTETVHIRRRVLISIVMKQKPPGVAPHEIAAWCSAQDNVEKPKNEWIR